MVSKEQYLALKRELEGKPKAEGRKSKYNNQVVYEDGFRFASQLERNRYIELKLLLRAGEIRDLQLQVSFQLVEAVEFEGEDRIKPAMKYVADFVYIVCKTGKMVVEDTKSEITAKKGEYRQKKHLMKAVHGIEIIEIRQARK